MVNDHLRVEYRAEAAMQPSRQINILSVKENPLVEQSCCAERLHSKEHKTAWKKGHVHYLVISRKVHLILMVELSMNVFELMKQPPCDERERRRQQPTQVLKPSIGIKDFRRDETDLVIGFHERKKPVDNIGREVHVRIQDHVIPHAFF